MEHRRSPSGPPLASPGPQPVGPSSFQPDSQGTISSAPVAASRLDGTVCAPISAATLAARSGCRLLITTEWPAARNTCASPLPTTPAPMTAIRIAASFRVGGVRRSHLGPPEVPLTPTANRPAGRQFDPRTPAVPGRATRSDRLGEEIRGEPEGVPGVRHGPGPAVARTG